jgi:hypothetical protein
LGFLLKHLLKTRDTAVKTAAQCEADPSKGSFGSIRQGSPYFLVRNQNASKEERFWEFNVPENYVYDRGRTAPYVIVDVEILVGILQHFGRCPQCDAKLIPWKLAEAAPSGTLGVKCLNGHNMKIPLSRKLGEKSHEIPSRFIMCATMAAIRPKQIEHLCSAFGLPVPPNKTMARHNARWGEKMTAFAEVYICFKLLTS